VLGIHGAITALITPFRDGKLDLPALERLVEAQISAGIDGLVPCGTTGEAPTLHGFEFREVIECVVKTARHRVPVIAGAGANSTEHAIELSRTAAKLGADALLHVAPYYNKPTQAGLYAHFDAIAGAVDLPIVLYNIPGRCGVEIQNATIQRLRAAHRQIVAVKHATGRVDDAADLLQISDIAVVSGDDPLTLALMSLGATGVISVVSNLAPRMVKRLTQAMLKHDLVAAREAHRATHALARSLLSLETNPIPIKTAMAMRGWCGEEFRLPMCPLQPENRARLEQLLREHPAE
jgi:4-hydroxy-tetrahydrodipicolinate synthase